MIIFLNNLPAHIKKYELADFLNKAYAASRLAAPQIAIRDIEILTTSDADMDISEKYALVKVFPKQSGTQLLRWVDGKRIKQGPPINAHEYVYRTVSRRQAVATETGFAERRHFERRSKLLKIVGKNVPLSGSSPDR